MVAVIHDLPPEELRFHWKSGRVCLDFVATVGERWRRSFERLLSPADLDRWFIESGLLKTPPARPDDSLPPGGRFARRSTAWHARAWSPKSETEPS
jgi:Putative stress-induced transcription regulator